ncbi:flagellar hook-length control protein FliK [Arenibacterium sp. CAU 1754]
MHNIPLLVLPADAAPTATQHVPKAAIPQDQQQAFLTVFQKMGDPDAADSAALAQAETGAPDDSPDEIEGALPEQSETPDPDIDDDTSAQMAVDDRSDVLLVPPAAQVAAGVKAFALAPAPTTSENRAQVSGPLLTTRGAIEHHVEARLKETANGGTVGMALVATHRLDGPNAQKLQSTQGLDVARLHNRSLPADPSVGRFDKIKATASHENGDGPRALTRPDPGKSGAPKSDVPMVPLARIPAQSTVGPTLRAQIETLNTAPPPTNNVSAAIQTATQELTGVGTVSEWFGRPLPTGNFAPPAAQQVVGPIGRSLSAATIHPFSASALLTPDSGPEVQLALAEVMVTDQDPQPTSAQRVDPPSGAGAATEAIPLRAEPHRIPTAQAAQILVRSPNQPVEISLNPEELGRVRMALTTSDAGVSLVITTDRTDTLDLMRRHIDQLAQDFKNLGYESIDFAFHQGHSGDHGANSQDQGATVSIADAEESSAPLPQNRPATAGLDLRL